ncbi:neuropeptide SIFamide receptor-like, partial [Uloborus diversus]|uniref:neuropeptide SIFamide receptor-like n=1 Tax=Uloborus diversus TaxID=327109 RepID=UPI0024095B8B
VIYKFVLLLTLFGLTLCICFNFQRFLAICLPMRYQMTSHSCRCVIATIWAFSAIVAFPWIIVFNLIFFGKTSDNEDLYVCREVWPTERMGNAYFIVANLILCYLLPLFVIMVCYSFIWIRVWKRKTPGEGEHNNGMIQKSRIKVIKMLFTVVLVFMGSWFPLYAIFTRIKVGEPYQENSWEESIIQLLAPFAQWLGASNSCVNPLLYAFFNNRFRAGLVEVLSGEKCCRCAKKKKLRFSSGKAKTLTTSAKTKNITSVKKCGCETIAL